MKVITYLLLTLFFYMGSVSALAVTLKESHEVQKEFLMLSDFFDDIPQDRDQEILEAPAQGNAKHYPHAWVRRLAQNFGLYWTPKHYKGITLTRNQYVAKSFDVQKLIKNYVSQNYASKIYENSDLVLDTSPSNQKLYVGTTEPKLINFSWLDNERFVATLDAGGQETNVKGRITKVIYVPVLKRALQPGNVIEKEDIEYKAFPQHKITAHIIQSEQDLIGRTVRRNMPQIGNMINTQDIINPILIKRGDLVTMRVENAGVLITARGKAQGNAAAGQVVQVMNLESKRLIEGVVKDSQIVVIPTVTR